MDKGCTGIPAGAVGSHADVQVSLPEMLQSRPGSWSVAVPRLDDGAAWTGSSVSCA
jgi:hypothetical protein